MRSRFYIYEYIQTQAVILWGDGGGVVGGARVGCTLLTHITQRPEVRCIMHADAGYVD